MGKRQKKENVEYSTAVRYSWFVVLFLSLFVAAITSGSVRFILKNSMNMIGHACGTVDQLARVKGGIRIGRGTNDSVALPAGSKFLGLSHKSPDPSQNQFERSQKKAKSDRC